MLYQDRDRAPSFGANPDLCDRIRPSYPDELASRLFADGARDVLDAIAGVVDEWGGSFSTEYQTILVTASHLRGRG